MSRRYEVQQGDTIASIAAEFGLFPDTVWNHPDNSELKSKRKDPHVLMPGDVVHIPDLRIKEFNKPAGSRHRFRRKGVPKFLELRLLDEGEPMKELEYRIEIDGQTSNGKTNADGLLKHPIALNAQRAKLSLSGGMEYQIELGQLDPVEEPSGIQKRLRNLGYYNGALDSSLNEAAKAGLKRFQISQGLEPTGTADEETKNRLKELNGA